MANPLDITLHASAAETSSGTGTVVDLGATRSCVKIALVATAVSGTLPTLAVALQTGPTLTGPWRSGGTVASFTAAGKTEITLADLDEFVQATWTIGGTAGPSFTFSLAGQAHTIYCDPADLTRIGISQGALAAVDAQVVADCCLRASADFETALNSAYELPITGWGEDLRGHCAARAVYYAMTHRGMKPQSGDAESISRNGGFRTAANVKSAAQMFLDAVASGVLKPIGIVDQTPDDYEGSGVVVSGTQLYR